jgi:hypothetical protein
MALVKSQKELFEILNSRYFDAVAITRKSRHDEPFIRGLIKKA